MEELDIFESLVIEALAHVPQSYYGTVYRNIDSFRMALSGRQGRFNDNDFVKYGERVFCYELYHQLKSLIDRYRRDSPQFLAGTELQGEVDKMQILGLIERFGLTGLSREFVPDFLMHSPGNADNHPFVIEVKCVRGLSPFAIIRDLEKLDEFIIRYRYQRGLFITVNSENEEILATVERLKAKILQLAGIDRIKILQKDNQNSRCNIIPLWQIFQEY